MNVLTGLNFDIATSMEPRHPYFVKSGYYKAEPVEEAASDDASTDGTGFDIFEWYPCYQSCQRYFLDHAQHNGPVQAVSAFLNIRLPFQKQPNPLFNSRSSSTSSTAAAVPAYYASPSSSSSASSSAAAAVGAGPGPRSVPTATLQPPPPPPSPPTISLIPYIRRLVATGMDFPGILQGFFGDDWRTGIGSIQQQERRNYMFAAKSGGWSAVKKDYDIPPQETIPFLRPLQGSSDSEIETAEDRWSEWLSMEDWMLGPRSPNNVRS